MEDICGCLMKEMRVTVILCDQVQPDKRNALHALNLTAK